MANIIPASEQLRDVANKEKKALTGTNEYKEDSSEYSATHPNALSDGDEKGKGADQGIGGKTDIVTRNQNLAVNMYSSNNEYKSPE